MTDITTEGAAGEVRRLPRAAELTFDDLRAALDAGVEDFQHFRSDVIILCLLYPLLGGLLVLLFSTDALLPLLFPIISGFALVGPLAAVGLYEMSRKRAAGEAAGWGDALGMLRSPAIPSILAMAIVLLGLFIAWLFAANVIYSLTLGPEPPGGIGPLAAATFGTAAGWGMLIVGCLVGFVFAAVVLVLTVVSMPMIVDRTSSFMPAVLTSIAVARRNPRVIGSWGAIVAVSLVLGSIPALLGLVIVLPVLGHATWHLYRRAVRYD